MLRRNPLTQLVGPNQKSYWVAPQHVLWSFGDNSSCSSPDAPTRGFTCLRGMNPGTSSRNFTCQQSSVNQHDKVLSTAVGFLCCLACDLSVKTGCFAQVLGR